MTVERFALKLLYTVALGVSIMLVAERVHAETPTRAHVAAAVDPAFRSSAPWDAVAIAAIADVATTEAIVHRGNCRELNPIYGPHPALAPLVTMHAIPLALLWPARHSKWLYVPAALLGAVAIHNATLRCH